MTTKNKVILNSIKHKLTMYNLSHLNFLMFLLIYNTFHLEVSYYPMSPLFC